MTRRATRPKRWIQIPSAHIMHLMTNERAKGKPGRRSRGDRYPLTVRIPRAEAERLIAYSDATGVSRGDLVTGLIARHIDEFDVDALEAGDNTLPLEDVRQTA